MFIVFGISHKTAHISIREKFGFKTNEIQQKITQWRKIFNDSELVLLSTCNRFEFYIYTEDNKEEITKNFFEFFQISDLKNFFYIYENKNAIRHLFEVSSGLDSLILGENEILRQLKDAYLLSKEIGGVGKWFNILFQRALYIGKLVRTNSKITEGPTSISKAVLILADKLIGEVKNQKLLIIGAGNIASSIAKYFKDYKADITVTNHNPEKGKLLAEYLGCNFLDWQSIPSNIFKYDVVITSTHAKDFLIKKDDIEKYLYQRDNKKIFFIDLSVPRNIEPKITSLENVYLYNTDDLRSIVDETLKIRKNEIESVRKIIEEKIEEFYEYYIHRKERKFVALRHQ